MFYIKTFIKYYLLEITRFIYIKTIVKIVKLINFANFNYNFNNIFIIINRYNLVVLISLINIIFIFEFAQLIV